MSIVAPITATGVVVPVSIGLATGDDLSPAQAAGVVLAIGGVVLAARERAVVGRARVAAGAGIAVVAAVAFGLVLVALDAAAEGDALWATLVMRATAWSCSRGSSSASESRERSRWASPPRSEAWR